MSVIHADNNFISINNNSHLKSVRETSRLCSKTFSLAVGLLPVLFFKKKNITPFPLTGQYVPNNLFLN